MTKKLFILVLLLPFLNCCKEDFDVKKWSEEQRKYVLNTWSIVPDRIDTIKYPSGVIMQIAKFYKGRPLVKKYFGENSSVYGEKTFGLDTNIQLRQERGIKKRLLFDGLAINNMFYGWSTWYYKNGNKRKEGLRIKNLQVGKWTFYSEAGQVDSVKDYENYRLIDTLKFINFR